MSDWTVAELVEDFKAGLIHRRAFVRTLLGAGVGMPVIAAILAACGSSDKKADTTSSNLNVPAQGTASAANPAASAAAPAAFVPTKRGGGGTLKLFWNQAPLILNPHLTNGTKDRDGSRIALEPLAAYANDGTLVPFLAAEIPTADKGTLDKAGKFVVWKLKKGVTWHDGTPFTAEDVVFTWQYASDPETAALSSGNYTNVQNVEKVDDLTVRVTFKQPTLSWTDPFVGGNGMILPKHIHGPYKGKESRNAPANLKPIGTGPYKVIEFRPGDQVLAEMYDKYHVENRPFFDKLEMKGGGDAAGAARLVLQTGEYDYAWNLQVEASILTKMEKDGGQGTLLTWSGGSNEFISFNFTDPNIEVDGERSSLKNPHPFFTDPKVRQAFVLAVDRKTIVEQLYGPTGTEGTVFLYAPKRYAPDVKITQDVAKANQLLDEAGWKKGGDGVRSKDGKRMKLLYQTSVNALRQNEQAVVKKNLEAIGAEVELKAVIADVFFSADPANGDNYPHFYADLQMYTTTRSGPDDAIVFMNQWITPEIPQKATSWAGQNRSRYRNPAYDAVYNQARTELDPVKFADLVKKLNQTLTDDFAFIPLVSRNTVGAAKKNLKGMDSTGWDSDLWKLAYWYRV